MRAALALAVLASSALVVPTLGQDRAMPPSAGVAERLARAREALGGEARLSAVRTLRLTGRVTRGLGHGKRYGHFELVAQLPASFVWTEHVPSRGWTSGTTVDDMSIGPQDSPFDLTIRGIDRGRLVYPRPPQRGVSSRPDGPLTAHEQQVQLRSARADFVRMTLGIFAASFEAAPIRFEPVTDGTAVHVSDPNFGDVLTFDPATHRPAQFGDVAYEDFREVRGVMVPHRITEKRGEYESVWRVERAEIDVTLPARTFRR